MKKCIVGIDFGKTNVRFGVAEDEPELRYYTKSAYTRGSPDEMHEHMLSTAYGSEVHRTRLGLRIRPLQRSSDASREDYSMLIETLIRTAAEMGFVVPPPERRE